LLSIAQAITAACPLRPQFEDRPDRLARSDLPVKTASVIKLGILLDAAEQVRAGHASLSEKLTLTHENQVPGSGVIGQLTAPLSLTLGDTLHLMVVLSDNTATNLAIDRLGWRTSTQPSARPA